MQEACPTAHGFKDKVACGKAMRQWCKDNGVKNHFADDICAKTLIANLNATTQASEEKAKAIVQAAQDQDQAALDQVAMGSYAQVGKPTGLSFTEWEMAEIHAWKADTKTTLGISDWLKVNLTH
jgi:hypothetical protein